MKHLVSYKLFESVLTLNNVYIKYYSNIEKPKFLKIVNSDPTSKPNKLGVYCKWLLNLYLSGNLKFEDLYKATEYLKTFHRFKHTLPIEQRNINNIKKLSDLAKIIDVFHTLPPDLLSKSENFSKAFNNSFEKYDLYIPDTYEQSRDLGRGTKWCTAADSEEGEEIFEEYNNTGILYILISKTDPKEKYQFHFEELQFMDRYDSEINLINFLELNRDIEKYFKQQMNDILKYLDFNRYKEKKLNEHPNNKYYYFEEETEYCMILNEKNNKLFVVFEKIWGVFSNIYRYEYEKIQQIIKNKMYETFNLKDIVPNGYCRRDLLQM